MQEHNDTKDNTEKVDTTNPCVYCQAKESILLYPTYSIHGDTYHMNRCIKCNTVFLTPKPTSQQLEQAYSTSYYGEDQTKFNKHLQKAIDFFCKARVNKAALFVKPPGRILDIGCGDGCFLKQLIKRGFECHGIELPGKAAERAGQVQNLNLKMGELSRSDYPDNHFDIISMWHVFEHLSEPAQTLEIIQNILKPGGHLLISLPNIESFQSRLFKGKWLHLDPPAHLFFLGPTELKQKMREFDMKLVTENHFSLTQNTFGMQQSLLNCIFKHREILYEALKGNQVYAKEYSKLNILMQTIFWLITLPFFVLISLIEAGMRKGGTMTLVFRKQPTK